MLSLDGEGGLYVPHPMPYRALRGLIGALDQ